MVCADFIERLARCDRIDHNEAFGSAQILFADSPEKWKLRAGIELRENKKMVFALNHTHAYSACPVGSSTSRNAG